MGIRDRVFRRFTKLLVLLPIMAGLALPSMASTFIVLNTSDSGAGSLDAAMLDANASPGADVIDFDIGGSPLFIISLVSPLPTVTGDLTIDGTSEPGYAGTPLIEIDTSDLATPGIAFTASEGVSLDVEGIGVIPSVPEPLSSLSAGAGLLGVMLFGQRARRKRLGPEAVGEN